MIRRCLSFALCLAASAAVEALDLPGLAAAIERPAVTGEIELTTPLVLGRGELRPGAGAKIYQLAAQDAPCGVWVKGPATFTYRIEDRFSRPTAERNLKSASGLVPVRQGESLVVTLPLDEALVWGWDVAPAVAPAAGTAVAFSSWAGEVLAGDFGDNPARDLLLARANGGAGYRYALLRSGRGEFVLDVDARAHVRSESLARLEPLAASSRALAGRRAPYELATQPIGRQWWEPVAVPYVVTAVNAEVENDRGAHVVAVARTKVEAATSGLSLLAFSLPDWVLDGDGRLLPVALQAVTVDGRPAAHRFAAGSLLVALPQPLATGESATVETRVEGDFAQRPGGDNYFTLGAGEMAPVPADNARSLATWDVTFTAPRPFVPFASGETVGGDGQRLHSRVAGPVGTVGGPVVVAGKYVSVREQADDYRATVSTYAHGKEEAARRLLRNFFAAKQCYETWFGVPYPFEELDIVEINDWGFGVAPPGVIFITKEAFNTATTARATAGDEEEAFIAAIASRGVNERFAHEVAHGYFGHTVLPAAPEDRWIGESFADYAAAVCIQRTSPNPREGARRFQLALREWKHGAGDTKRLPIYLADHLAGQEESDAELQRNLLYAKGPLVLHAIRQELGRLRGGAEEGDAYFFAFLRAVVRNFVAKPIETRQLPLILQQMTSTDWQRFFEDYVYGPELPAVK